MIAPASATGICAVMGVPEAREIACILLYWSVAIAVVHPDLTDAIETITKAVAETEARLGWLSFHIHISIYLTP